MRKLADNLWVMHFPLALLRFIRIGRTVTIIRLSSGELLIHSTAPFTGNDVATIESLGRPAAILEATLMHDTFAAAAHAVFPNVPIFAPDGFSEIAHVPTRSIAATPETWSDEVGILPLEGMPKVQEHVVFHRSTRTLIVGDIIFNFGPDTPPLTRFMLRWATGLKHNPGMSRMFRMMVRDENAFRRSVQQMMRWEFDRVIPGHGRIIEGDGGEQMLHALQRRGF
jgi:hypothetical protein